jgi:hypothetical protein
VTTADPHGTEGDPRTSIAASNGTSDEQDSSEESESASSTSVTAQEIPLIDLFVFLFCASSCIISSTIFLSNKNYF